MKNISVLFGRHHKKVSGMVEEFDLSKETDARLRNIINSQAPQSNHRIAAEIEWDKRKKKAEERMLVIVVLTLIVSLLTLIVTLVK
jgi:hypothetical protein